MTFRTDGFPRGSNAVSSLTRTIYAMEDDNAAVNSLKAYWLILIPIAFENSINEILFDRNLAKLLKVDLDPVLAEFMDSLMRVLGPETLFASLRPNRRWVPVSNEKRDNDDIRS